MKIETLNRKVKAQCTLRELWFLSRFFSSGVLVGFEDPDKNATEEERKKIDQEVMQQLVKSNILSTNSKGEIVIDELVGGMFYSCIHSDMMLRVTDKITGDIWYCHFLPDWQLSFRQSDGNCEFHLYENKEQLYEEFNIIAKSDVDTSSDYGQIKILERELEMDLALLRNGNTAGLTKLLNSSHSSAQTDMLSFLASFQSFQKYYHFDTYYNRNLPGKNHSTRNGLLETEDNCLFWMFRGYTVEEDYPLLTFIPVDATTAIHRFLSMLNG